MKAARDSIQVSILGREFSVVCPEDEQAALSLAASHLDQRMRQIQRSGKVIGIEKCAIMAALNITHEMLQLKQRDAEAARAGARLKALQDKIDAAMQENGQLPL